MTGPFAGLPECHRFSARFYGEDRPIESHPQQELVRPSAKGDVRLLSFCRPERIRGYPFDSQFGRHAQYKSLYTRRESLEEIAALPDANVVLAISGEGHIIGFGVLTYPEPGERWADLGTGEMMEVKAVEVSREWRSAGVARSIIAMLLTHPRIEEIIVYMVGYSWTWDLDGSGLTAQQYRNMLIRLFAPHGFQEFQTNEPNICLKPENVFMGRIGMNVPETVQKDFKWLRFGVVPGAAP